MKILARQLTLDLYNCNEKKLADLNAIKSLLNAFFSHEPDFTAANIDHEHSAIIGAFREGHVALHVYSALHYVAADIFTCTENSNPDALEKILRQFFQPDKIKSTFLKRGDFGQNPEITPKIKTRVAPLRRVRNVGAKVVKTLIRRGN